MSPVTHCPNIFLLYQDKCNKTCIAISHPFAVTLVSLAQGMAVGVVRSLTPPTHFTQSFEFDIALPCPIQEMASRGVSLVYSLGDEVTRRTLMAALVGVLQGAPQAKTAVKLSGDTQVGIDTQIHISVQSCLPPRVAPNTEHKHNRERKRKHEREDYSLGQTRELCRCVSHF